MEIKGKKQLFEVQKFKDVVDSMKIVLSQSDVSFKTFEYRVFVYVSGSCYEVEIPLKNAELQRVIEVLILNGFSEFQIGYGD